MLRLRITNGVLDTEAIKLRLREAAPHFGLVDLVRVVQTALDADDVLDKDAHRKGMFVVLLVDRQRLLVQPVLGGNARDPEVIVVLEPSRCTLRPWPCASE